MLPKISVITPSFNQGSFIEQTIRSVLKQDYPNLEYIVIDGGSTDETVSVIKRYSSRIAYWVSESDRGQTHAINKGLSRATGDIIAYINSDDYYLPGALEKVARYWVEHPDCDLVHGQCEIVDHVGALVRLQQGDIRSLEQCLDLWGVWWGGGNFVQPEVFWTRRMTEKIGPFREDLHWVMDYDYWARIFAVGGRAGFIDDRLAAFRLHPLQKSTQPERTANELLSVVRPYLFSKSTPIGRKEQIRLRAEWMYHAEFLPRVRESIACNEPPARRRAKLAGYALSHPSVLLAGPFRTRLTASVKPLFSNTVLGGKL